MVKDLKILLIEDSVSDVALIQYQFSKQKVAVDWVLIDSPAQFRVEIEKQPDLVISDVEVPGFGAYAALQILAETQILHPPLVVISGAVGEEVAVEAMKAGAKDFLVKSNLSKIASISLRAIREASLERIEAEQRDRAEKAIRDRERLLEIVSHDLKNPLGAMTLNLQILKAWVDEPASPTSASRAKALVERLERSVGRVDRLIRDVLDQAKIEAGKFVISPHPAKLDDLFAELREDLEPVAVDNEIELVFETNLESSEFRVDQDRLLQVFSNLVSNAIKFSVPGNKVRVTADEELSIPEVGDTAEPSSWIRFSVKDQGAGIPESDLDLVFTKFWQAPDRQKFGTGLGLSIARQIVEAHGGEIGVRSVVGQGSEFWFVIPRYSGSDADGEDVTGQASKIMLLEDDEDLREVVHESLEAAFEEVLSYPSTEPAFAKLATGYRPDLYIIDHDLPGMSGGDFIREIRKLGYIGPHTRVVLTSAHPDLKDRAKALGVTDILQKPFNLKKLRSHVEDWRS